MYQEQTLYSHVREETLHQGFESSKATHTSNGFCRQEIDLSTNPSDADTNEMYTYECRTIAIQHLPQDSETLTKLYLFSLRMHQSMESEHVLRHVLNGMFDLSNAQSGWIAVRGTRGDAIRWLSHGEQETMSATGVESTLASDVYTQAIDQHCMIWVFDQRKETTIPSLSGQTQVILPILTTSGVSAILTLTYQPLQTHSLHLESLLISALHIVEQALENSWMYKSIVDKDAARESTINRLVHDIRSPLMSTSASIDVIQRVLKNCQVNTTMQDFMQESLDSGKRGILEVLNLTNDLLDTKKIQSNHQLLDYNEVLVEFVFDEVHKLLYSLAVQKKVIIRYHVQPRALKFAADIRLVRRAIVNLAANALRFSPVGSTVTMKAASSDDNASVLLTVEDMGTGVALTDRERIFLPFVQAIGESHRGTGIGLAFCREVTLAHGGQIWVEDREGGGSRFCMLLPVNPPPKP